MKKKLLVICGPTATGKTQLGINLAKLCNAEIISADSRQVYRGMNIGTGKDIGGSKFNLACRQARVQSSKLESKIQKELNQKITVGAYWVQGILIWGLDLVEPNQVFSVAHYAAFARRLIKSLWAREKLPILVGGSGFYIKAVIDGVDTLGVAPNWELRWQLDNLSPGELFKIPARLDPEKAALLNLSDRQNPRRLIRAIEISQKNQKTLRQKRLNIDHLLMLGLKANNQVLYERIDRRVERRVKQGIEQEIKRLLKNYDWQNSALSQTLGYQEWEPYFKDEAGREEVIQRWKYNEHGYARRQLTWFKKFCPETKFKNRQIKWFDIARKNWQASAKKLVRNWAI